MIKFNEVTWYSRLAAILVFVGGLPVLAFYIGATYQKTIEASAVGTYVGDLRNNTLPLHSTNTFGTYRYDCDEHVSFLATFAGDMSNVRIKPADKGIYPPQVTLMQKKVSSGVRYEGDGVVFMGKGEEVTLNEGDATLHCSPALVSDEAPMNFGD